MNQPSIKLYTTQYYEQRTILILISSLVNPCIASSFKDLTLCFQLVWNPHSKNLQFTWQLLFPQYCSAESQLFLGSLHGSGNDEKLYLNALAPGRYECNFLLNILNWF